MKKAPKFKWTSCDDKYPKEKTWNIVLCGDPAVYVIAYWVGWPHRWEAGYGDETARRWHLERDLFWTPIPDPPEGYREMPPTWIPTRDQ